MRSVRTMLFPLALTGVLLAGPPAEAGKIARAASKIVHRVGGTVDRHTEAWKMKASSLAAGGAPIRAQAMRIASTVVGGALGFNT